MELKGPDPQIHWSSCTNVNPGWDMLLKMLMKHYANYAVADIAVQLSKGMVPGYCTVFNSPFLNRTV